MRDLRVLRSPLVLVGMGWALLLAVLAARQRDHAGASKAAFTTGDIRAMHADVRVAGHEVRGAARLADGDHVETGPDGRARVRLDDGTLVVLDGGTALDLHDGRITLARGRLFVQGGAASRTDVAIGGATTTVSSSAAAFDAGSGSTPASVYCVRGELVIDAAGHGEHVSSGETATFGRDGTKVAPEVAFDDWTGGLAVPWAGETGQASAIPMLWGGAAGEDPGSPLVVHQAKVDVTIEGEVAVTRTRTTYFNGSDRAVSAEIRMALPPGAIVSRVARADEGKAPVDASVAVGAPSASPSSARLEWAGGGWLRGELPSVPSGESVDLFVDYVEWLPERAGHETYRFPMGGDGQPPMIGELAAQVATTPAAATWVSASAGTTVDATHVELQRGDFRPTGDLVVEVTPSVVRRGAARAYVMPGEKGEDPYVLVRTEVPEAVDTGVTLALVVDTSFSAGASLETERAVVDAVLQGLGSKDSLVVLAYDQTVRPVGPAQPAPVTPALREDVRRGLAAIDAGGASNVGQALEQAADVLDAQGPGRAGAGMVVYIGDGRPTVGETSARDLRRRLGRRSGGMPRLGAVSVGYGADRWMLAQLVVGSGPVYEAVDRSDAARVGASIVADALEPTLREIDLDLGPTIDRVYPREARAALAGSTVTVTGRLRGKLPSHIGFRYRRGADRIEESRILDAVSTPPDADVAKRWAAARIDEMATRDEGIEPAVALAARAGLLTPWTSWFFGGAIDSWSFDQRVLGLSPTFDSAFAARIQPAPSAPSLLLEPPKDFEGDDTLDDAARSAAERAIEERVAQLEACRDARASVRPDVAGSLVISVSVGADGRAADVHVSASPGSVDDPVLDRCARSVVSAIMFFAAGTRITITHALTLPPARTSRRTQCSVASTLPLPVRRGLWRARLQEHHLDYVSAAHACELPTWSDRRALLELLMDASPGASGVALATSLDEAGETDAATFVRQEVLRRVSSAAELEVVSRTLIGNEPKIDGALDKAYRAARSDGDRLAVVRRFLRLAPHDALARRRLFALLEALGDKDVLVSEIDRARADPFADAGLLAAGASALRRLGMDDEGRRAFGELIERAPGDPWALAYVGDRMRAEGLYDDAVEVYERLDQTTPDDPAVALRLALAHAGAGRLDVATRLLERASQTGGRTDDGRIGELASMTEAVLLAGARQASQAPDMGDLLGRRLSRTPLPDVASVVVVRSPPADDPVEVRIARGERGRDEDPADLDAPSMGLSAIRVERGSGPTRIRLRRPAAIGVGRPIQVTVMALVLAEDRRSVKLVTRDVLVGADGSPVELQWNGEAWL